MSKGETRRERPRHNPKGRVITFYSYKGGTGRSMAVANVAWILAMSGERVLVVDWDLEAPGIHRYFHPFLDDKELASTLGLLDFVDNLKAHVVSASPATLDSEDVDVISYVKTLKWPPDFEVQWERFGPFAGIDLLAAGRQGPAYSVKLNTFNWTDFYEKLGGSRLLEAAREQLRSVYDYVLIDSRTGVSDTSGICTVEMPDTLFVCFTLNDQSITGASGVAESVLAQRRRRDAAAPLATSRAAGLPFRIFPVPTRVEIGSEREKRQVALAIAQQKFASFLDHLAPEDTPGKYWGRVQLAYFAFYAFEEIPAVFGDPADEELSLMTPLKRIAQAIIGNTPLELTPLAQTDAEAERLRKQILGWYLRKTTAGALDPVQLAQRTYDEADRYGQRMMRSVLLRLVQVVAGAAPSAATVPIEDFDGRRLEMLRKLADAGVVQISGAAAFLADRALVEGWDLLRKWLKQDEAFLLWRQNLIGPVRSWELTGHDPSALLRGKVLEEALAWLDRNPDDFNDRELAFLAASRKQEERRVPTVSINLPGTRIHLRIPLVVFIICGIVALVLLGWDVLGYVQRGGRERSQLAAAIVSLARNQANADPLLSALLLAELPDYAAAETDRQLALKIAGTPYPEAMIRGDSPFRSLEFARDGSRVVTAGDNGAGVWAAGTWKRLASVGSGLMLSASFNGWVPDRAKSRGGSGQIDKIVTTAANGAVTVSTLDGSPVMQFFAADPAPAFFSNCSNRLAGKKPSLTGKSKTGLPNLGRPVYARFSPDEVVVIVAYEKGALVMVNAKNGACFDIYDPKADSPAAFSPDGEWAATASRAGLTRFHVQDWKQDFSGLPVGAPATGVAPLAISFSGQVLTPLGIIDALGRRTFTSCEQISLGSFSWDAKSVAGARSNHAQWCLVDSAIRLELDGHTDEITAAVFDPSGARVLTASLDKTVRIWPTQKQAPSPLATWSELAAYFQSSTRVCLTAGQRTQFLKEDPATAAAKAQSCEARRP